MPFSSLGTNKKVRFFQPGFLCLPAPVPGKVLSFNREFFLKYSHFLIRLFVGNVALHFFLVRFYENFIKARASRAGFGGKRVVKPLNNQSDEDLAGFFLSVYGILSISPGRHIHIFLKNAMKKEFIVIPAPGGNIFDGQFCFEQHLLCMKQTADADIMLGRHSENFAE